MTQSLSPQEREALLLQLLLQLAREEITQGELLRILRKRILHMNQEQYATLANVSRRTLSDIERDRGNQSLPVLTSVFKPLGLKPGLVPRNSALFDKLLHASQ